LRSTNGDCDNDVNDNKTVSATQTKKISENQGIDNQNNFNELVDDGNSNCNEVWRSSEVELQIEDKEKITASISCKPDMDTHGSRKENSASSKSHSKGKKRKQTEYVTTNKKSKQCSDIPNNNVIDSEDNAAFKKKESVCNDKLPFKTKNSHEVVNESSVDEFPIVDKKSMTKLANKTKSNEIDDSLCKRAENTLPSNIKNNNGKNISTFICVKELSPSCVMMNDQLQVRNPRRPDSHDIKVENFEQPHNQPLPNEMVKKFHKSMKMCIYQCTVCHEAWPRQTKPSSIGNYVCSRCVRDKSIPKKFSSENSMIPSPVPKELQELTQFEEMLIARAFPVMHVYTKPRGGQKAYKGHVITLPQDVQQLADVLPRCPKDLPVLVFTIKGKDNNSKDFTVRRQKVSDALYWLTGVNDDGEPNNHLYQTVKIDKVALQALPENGSLPELTKIECADDSTTEIDVDVGPIDPGSNERVYNEESEMSSYLPTSLHKKKEKEIIHDQFLGQNEKHDWHIGREPLSEFSVQYLAAMSFPTLFPDDKGDPTNNATLLNTSDSVTDAFANKLKHLMKFGEKKNGKWVYRFASHPRFGYWAYNMLYRRRILGKEVIF